jgi:hypothetical protein
VVTTAFIVDVQPDVSNLSAVMIKPFQDPAGCMFSGARRTG